MKITVTIRLEEKTNEQLRKLVYLSGKTKGEIITEALEILMKTPKETKK